MSEDLQLVAVAAGLAVAGIVKGATGIGYATCALPLLAQTIGLKPAMALVIAPTLAVNATMALSGGHLRATVRALAPLYAAMVPGVAAGGLLLVLLDERIAMSVLGSSMMVYAAFALTRPQVTLSEGAARKLTLPVGFATGLLTGLTGSQAVPLVPYLMALGLDTARTIQAINIGVLLLSVMLGFTLVAADAVDAGLAVASLAAIVPALAGAALGAWVRPCLPDATVRALVLAVIGLGGLRMALL